MQQIVLTVARTTNDPIRLLLKILLSIALTAFFDHMPEKNGQSSFIHDQGLKAFVHLASAHPTVAVDLQEELDGVPVELWVESSQIPYLYHFLQKNVELPTAISR